jgi:DNA-binding winged helix-turn-helix (wHTH) protein
VSITIGEFTFDEQRLELYQRGERVKVDAQVLRLLGVLAAHPNTYMGHDALIATAWDGRRLGDNVVSVAIAKLRKALGDREGRVIQNAYGRGYRFALEASSPATSSAPPPAPAVAPPLVGRAPALRTLSQGLEAALGGRGGLYALIGEAGVGKTRLAESLAASAAERGAKVAWGRCYEDDAAAVLGPWLQIGESLGAEKPAAWLEARSDGAGPFAWHNTVQWLSELCRRHSAGAGALLVLDDVQWADAASLSLLLRALPDLTTQRLMIIVTVRAGSAELAQVDSAELHRVLGNRACTRVALDRLSEEDVSQYVAGVLGHAEPALCRGVFEKSEGNAFFMVELVRALEQGGAEHAELLRLRGPALEIVHSAVRRLPEATRELLVTASVLGRTFALGALAQLAAAPPASLLDALDPALRSGLLRAAGDDNTTFGFGHDLVRGVLYEGLPRSARARLHLRAAEYVATHGTGVASLRRTAELARHRLSALPEGDVPQAIEAARRAALAAERMGAHADAAGLTARALSACSLLDKPDPRQRAELTMDLTRQKRSGGIPDYGVQLAEAVAIARSHGYGDVLAGAGEIMFGGPGTLGLPGHTSVLEAARDALGPGDRELRARVLALLAGSSPYCRDRAQVQALLEEADSLAGPNGLARVVLLRQKIYFASGPGDESSAMALTAELERLVDGAPPEVRFWRTLVEFDRVLRAMARGASEEAAAMLAGFTAFARALRLAELIWHCERIAAIVRMNAGDLQYAQRKFETLRVQAEELGLHGRHELTAVDHAELSRYLVSGSERTAQFVRDLAPKYSDPPNVQAGKLRVLVRYGAVEQARAELVRFPVADLRILPSSRDSLSTLCDLASVSAAVGALEHAKVLYELLSPHAGSFAVGVSFHHFGAVELQLARLARALGEPARAHAHYEVALARHDAQGFVPLATTTRLEWLRSLVESGGAASLQRTLRDAIRHDAERVGMGALLVELERVDAR